jgi:mediator of RNA polymerase II transcription subunit 14
VIDQFGVFIKQLSPRDTSFTGTLRILLVGGEFFLTQNQKKSDFFSFVLSARVAYTKVEQQFKLRHIPYTHVNPTNGAPVTTELAHIQSSLARSVPALCVQSSDILSDAPAAEAAMPNIRVIPLNWWSDKKAQVILSRFDGLYCANNSFSGKVVTCVKLKYVQQPMGKRAGANIIRPSKRIIYDTTEAVVSFLSEDVDTCVAEFLEEWARVSKMVVIAREGGVYILSLSLFFFLIDGNCQC